MKTRIKGLLLPLSTVCLILYAVFLSDKLSEFVIEGLWLTVNCVLPTGLPFMIISDLYTSLVSYSDSGFFGRIFGVLFGMPDEAVGCYLTGSICGFPIGAMGVGDLYLRGSIDKERAERLIPIANNPSLSFIIGGVGLGMYKDLRVGIMLASAVQLSAIITGIILRKKISKKQNTGFITRQNYSFIASVKKSGLAFISIASFIMVFSVIGGVLEILLPDVFMPLVALFLEVTRGVKFFSSASMPFSLSLSLSAFTLAFGGISVLMQSMALLSNCNLKYTPYIFIKLLQGIFAFIITYSFSFFIFNL